MIIRLSAARTSPTVECSGSAAPSRVRTESIVTNAARAKNAKAMKRSAAFSRSSGSLAANCQATAAAERTSTTESRPKPISAAEDACRPAAIATTPSTTL